MLLQTLLMLAFWSGLYILHEQVAAIFAAEAKARERERREQEREAVLQRILGRWVSIHGDGAIVSFAEQRTITFCRLTNAGGWSRNLFGFRVDGATYSLQIDGFEDCRARIEGNELIVEFGEIGRRYFEARGLPWEGSWRFRRPRN